MVYFLAFIIAAALAYRSYGFAFIALVALIYFVRQQALESQQNARPGTSPRTPRAKKRFPYSKQGCVLTQNERAFFDALLPVVNKRYHVFTKMRMLDLFSVPADTQNRKGWTGRIIQKHVDFVLCDIKSLRPVLAIELDDSSHDAPDRQARDAFVDQVFEDADLPILHVRARWGYTVDFVREQIASALVPKSRTNVDTTDPQKSPPSGVPPWSEKPLSPSDIKQYPAPFSR